MTDEVQTTAQIDTDAAATGSDADTAATGDVDTTTVDQAADAGTDASTASAEGDDAASGDQPTGAPEQYEAFNYPEGYSMDEQATEVFNDAARAANLTQEQAQQLVDFDAQRFADAVATQQQAWEDTRTSWKQEIEKDADLGGARYEQTQTNMAKVLDSLGTPALRDFLNESGLGDHPEMVRLLAKAGAALGEDTLVSGEGGSGASRPSFYINSAMS